MAMPPYVTPATNARITDEGNDQLVSVDQAMGADKPKDEMAELCGWVMNRVKQWRDHRRANYEMLWDHYERLWRGLWAPEDKNKKSERATMVTPALGEAVENCVAEVEEALWGRGDLFEMSGEFDDSLEMKQVTDKNKARLKEDLDRMDFRAAMGEALINGAVYGSGIGEIILKKVKIRDIVIVTQAAMAEMGGMAPEMKVDVKELNLSTMQSVNPRNFLIDPIAKNIDDALGVAVEEYVGAHIVHMGQKDGDYRKVDVGTKAGDTELGADRQVENEYVHDKVAIVRYYGLVPKHLLLPAGQTVELFPESEGEQLVDALEQAEAAAAAEEQPVELFDEQGNAVSGQKSVEPIDAEMVEAIVVIANDGVVLKAVENPYMMQDRPVVAFPWDIVPGRFWGRGVCEKGQVPQRVLDAELRARLDALAFVSAPMMAMDASRLPKGFVLSVKPGKSILTNGDPKNVLNPIHFGQLDQSTFQHSQQLDQMVQRATGSLDVISLAQRAGGDARPGAVSMMLSGIVKRHKRTLMNFIEKFYVPALRKILWRNMEFAPDRYIPLNWTFNTASTMGILQREYESQQLVSLMQTMDPMSKEYKLLLMGVVANTGLTRRADIIKMIEESISNAAALEKMQTQQQVDPMQQQLLAKQAEYAIAKLDAEIAELRARANLQNAKAQNEVLEPQFKQVELATKGIYAAQENQDTVLERRMALVDRAIKLEDIQSNERIARIQSGQAVKAEAVKSAGAIASEAVRARTEARKAQSDERSRGRESRVNAFKARQEAQARAREARADERARAREAAANLGSSFVKATAPAGTPKPVDQGSGKIV
jgi:hypothetical protein